MKIDVAITECQRWLDYCQAQKDKSLAMQRLATARRNGEIDQAEANRRVKMLDDQTRVFDGAKLEQAIIVLLKHVGATKQGA